MLLQTIEIDVYYNGFHVLDKVSLYVKEGEIVTIVGSNGAGKSTILKAISGLITIKSGDIIFQKNSIKNLPAFEIASLGIIHIPEGRQLFPVLTVYDNLLLGAYSKRAKKDREARLEKILEILPILKKKMKQIAGSLSGGEQQMCAIGRGLMGDPILLMLDEPSLGLAPIVVEEVFETIKRIRNLGTSILLVEQNIELSAEISNRVYVLENRHIVMEGLPNDIKNNPELRKAYLGI